MPPTARSPAKMSAPATVRKSNHCRQQPSASAKMANSEVFPQLKAPRSSFGLAGVPQAFAAFETTDGAWRTLTLFAVYRVIVVIILAIIFWGFRQFPIIGSASTVIASVALTTYIFASIALIVATQLRLSSPTIQLTAQMFVDIVMLVLLMHASGGARSGLGMLLLISLAAGALVAHGRMAFFHAAVATLAVLFEQGWQFLYRDATAAEFVPSGMLATGYFVIAGLAYTLAKYAKGAEQIAEKRGIDLANLAQINELVIRDMQDGFVVVDEDGMIRQHNPQCGSLIGGLSSAIGQPLIDVAPQLARLLREWRMNHTRTFPIMRDSNTQREYQGRFVAIGDEEISPIVIFLEDASRVRNQAQQMKLVALGRLTASIAHEIRNPLSSINHAAELLQEDTNLVKTSGRLLTIINDNARRLNRLVEEVLDLNRRDRAHPEVVDPEDFLRKFLNEFCANEHHAPCLFHVQIATQSKSLFDRAHLDQILWNLCRNAVRFASGTDASISIVVARIGNGVAINVADDGEGVETDDMQHLFEPFFTTDTKGTGLGLYIARELAQVNGATLDYVVDSTVMSEHFSSQVANNRGAHFRLLMKATNET